MTGWGSQGSFQLLHYHQTQNSVACFIHHLLRFLVVNYYQSHLYEVWVHGGHG